VTGWGVRDPEGRLLDTSGPSPGWARVFLLFAEAKATVEVDPCGALALALEAAEMARRASR
jgi:hypothetical protein